MSAARALVLRTAGTNCDQETAEALRLAGARPEIRHIQQILSAPDALDDYGLLVIPGGFSYGDDVAAGRILANELRFKLRAPLERFIAGGKLVIGICNGFQVLVKAGYLPGPEAAEQTVTLAANDSGRFQCQWVRLRREKSKCRWLHDTDEEWELPIAHGEGKFVARDSPTLDALEKGGQVVFRYQGANPNGSARAIAGICNDAGNVLGLMPHPERHTSVFQHPEWTRRIDRGKTPVGLQLFKAAAACAARC